MTARTYPTVEFGLGVIGNYDVPTNLQVAGVEAFASDVRGLQIAARPIARNVQGSQIGFLGGLAVNNYGLQINGFVGDESNENVYGIQVGPLVCAKNIKVKGKQLGIISDADQMHGDQYGLLARATNRTSTGQQRGLLLWGPRNSWWNPSVFSQKLQPGKKLGALPTLEKLVKFINKF